MENIREELKILKKIFLPYLIGLLGISLFIFTFGIKRAELGFYYPFPSTDSISIYILKMLIDRLVPETVRIVALSPFNVFIVLLSISFAVGFIVTFPWLFYKVVVYLSPALYYNERQALLKTSIPVSLLFVAGVIVSYYLIIPQTFSLLYMFAGAAGVGELFHISQFIGLVLGLVIVVGIMFQLPIAMILLSKLGIVNKGFWEKKWKHALVGILIITAIITPDGTGVTMALLSLPILGLYLVGMLVSRKSLERRYNVQEV